jgi:outer membrane immunogenic protein
MRRFRFSALATILFVTGALSVPSAYAQCVTPNSGSNSGRASSWVGGGQLGYNWQQGAFVYGLETDLSGTGLKTALTGGLGTPGGGCNTDAASTNSTIDWYGTARGRAGWAAGQWLFFGTGGLAYGRVSLNSTYSGLGVVSTTAQTSSTKTGWVAGGGIEYLLQPNLLLNLSYQYVDLGTASVTSTSGALSQTASARAAFSVVSAGVSWRFAATNGPGPWGGLYLGGHGGGAWGDSTSAVYSTAPPSDARLKRDIVLVARLDDGLGLYQYRYLWSDTVYVGVMAQEVALIHPDAIVRGDLDDYLRVDYGRLGLKLMTLPEWESRNKAASL